MRLRLPIILSEPTFRRDELTNEELDPTLTNYSAKARRVERAGNERLFGDIEAGQWSSIFTVEWPSQTYRVNENWLLFDEFGIRHQINAVTRNPENYRQINIFATRLTTEAGEETPVTPTEPAITIRIGWSMDQTPEASELTASSTGNTVVIPAATGFQFLVIWRSDLAGGDPQQVHVASAGNSRNAYSRRPIPLTVDDMTGQAIVSVYDRNAVLLSGEAVRVL